MKKIYLFLLLVAGFAEAQIVNIPDANLKTILVSGYCVNVSETSQGGTDADTNNDGQIQLSEALAVTDLYIYFTDPVNDITGLEAFTNLTKLRIHSTVGCTINTLDFSGFPQLTELEFSAFDYLDNLTLSGLANLQQLRCTDNHSVTSLNLVGLTNLQTLDCTSNELTSLDLSGNPNLTTVKCSDNSLSTLDVTMLVNLVNLSTNYNSLTNLSVSGLANLEFLDCSENYLTSIDLTGLVSLKNLQCSLNQLTSLSLNGLNQLLEVNCAANLLPTFDASNHNTLQKINCSQNQLTALNLLNLTNLTNLSCNQNQLTALDANANTNMVFLDFNINQITSINVSALTNLITMYAGWNPLTALDVAPLIHLEALYCNNTQVNTLALGNLNQLKRLECPNSQLTALDISSCPLLALHCKNNLFTSLDLSSLTQLEAWNSSLSFGDNPNLEFINLKGINFNAMTFVDDIFEGCPNLQFVCLNEPDMPDYAADLALHPEIVSNSYCNFTPGGDYNTLSGTFTFDADGNGCTASDPQIPYLKVTINDGVNSGTAFTNTAGAYTFYTGTGNFTLTPAFENPYFNISPGVPVAISFTALEQEQTRNFCVSPNGFHPDLEVVLVPLGGVRPGFDTTYEIVYRNKGNQLQSGQINVIYNDLLTDFVSANPATANQLAGLLTWNFSNLMPFEVRTIHFTLNVNSPVENPPVNAGDLFTSTAQITNSEGEETPLDNTFTLDQIAVNSFDPNDKTCLEGNNVLPENIGKYLHYNINFENTGTADAINIVVKDTIDTTRFDINSLQLLYASHPVYTKITGNVVEFIFEGINLPPSIMNPIGGHGNVLFKIKTLPTLTVGDEVSNTANIYFDYNAPIDTNVARTAFNNLSKPDFVKDDSVTVYPNPAKNKVTVKATGTIKSVQLYDVQGRVLQSVSDSKSQVTLDIANQQRGVYFLTITTDKGSAVEKIIKD